MKHAIIERVEVLEADVQAGTVRQRLIKAGTSMNKRNYTESLLRGAAAKFEGAKTYANHQTAAEAKSGEGRRIEDTTGWLSNVRYNPQENALEATRHFSPNQKGQDAKALIMAVVEGDAPDTLLGASIHALGSGETDKDGVVQVESIDQVLSVDDVDYPAAGGGFEKLVASGSQGLLAALNEHMSYEEFTEGFPDHLAQLRKEMKTERQTDAVKTAKAEADRATAELAEAQAKLASLEESHKAELAEAKAEHGAAQAKLEERADRAEQFALKASSDLALEKALAKTKVPVALHGVLREAFATNGEDGLVEAINRHETAFDNLPQNPGIQESAARLPKPLSEGERIQRRDDWHVPRQGEGYAGWAQRTQPGNDRR